MNYRIILLVMKYTLVLIPISILFQNGLILEGGFLSLYLLIEILYQRVRTLEEKLNKMEEENGN